MSHPGPAPRGAGPGQGVEAGGRARRLRARPAAAARGRPRAVRPDSICRTILRVLPLDVDRLETAFLCRRHPRRHEFDRNLHRDPIARDERLLAREGRSAGGGITGGPAEAHAPGGRVRARGAGLCACLIRTAAAAPRAAATLAAAASAVPGLTSTEAVAHTARGTVLVPAAMAGATPPAIALAAGPRRAAAVDAVVGAVAPGAAPTAAAASGATAAPNAAAATIAADINRTVGVRAIAGSPGRLPGDAAVPASNRIAATAVSPLPAPAPFSTGAAGSPRTVSTAILVASRGRRPARLSRYCASYVR